MKKWQYIIIVLLGLSIAVAGSYFAYSIRHPYRYAEGEIQVAYVHPLVAQVERAKKLRAAGKLVEAQKLLREQLRLYPNAPAAQSARDVLGGINTEMFFSADNLFAKTEYMVKRGDSLWQIARRMDSTPAKIRRANNLDSDLIHPGERLIIPDSDFTLTLDLPNQRAVVHHGDGFFKQYPIADINLPDSRETRIMTTVMATTFWKNGRVISPDHQADSDAGSLRIQLANARYVLYGVDEQNEVSDSPVEISDENAEKSAGSPAPQGIALFEDDLAELRLLLRRGTPVTIIRSMP